MGGDGAHIGGGAVQGHHGEQLERGVDRFRARGEAHGGPIVVVVDRPPAAGERLSDVLPPGSRQGPEPDAENHVATLASRRHHLVPALRSRHLGHGIDLVFDGMGAQGDHQIGGHTDGIEVGEVKIEVGRWGVVGHGHSLTCQPATRTAWSCDAVSVRYRRMPIEVESPEQLGYDTITYNLSESSISDRRLGDLELELDLDELLLCYGDHLGDPLLRDAVAAGGDGLGPDDVLVTPGAAAALFCTATALLEPSDHLVVVRTNYATNLETPRAIGAELDIVDLHFANGWQLDVEELAARVRPGVTKLISVTCPHNPTGTMFDVNTLEALVVLAERSGAVLLVDETYRDLTRGELLPMAASLSPRAISVCSISKAYGLPGLRVGWAVCRDPQLAETLLAAKEQMVICGATLDEAIAGQVVADRDRVLPPILRDMAERFEKVRTWMAGQETFEWIEPGGGVVGLVRFRSEVDVDTRQFYDVLLSKHGTYVGPGHWFEVDDRHFRLGFGWPTHDELSAGLAGLSVAAAETML